FSARLDAESGDAEMDYLATTMNRMADFIDHNERSRKSFVSDVSHELRTPMTTIGGFVDSILNGTIPPEQQKHYLKIVSSEVNRMTRMVQSMLNISKFEEGSMKPNFKQFDITHLLIQTLLLFEEKAEAKHLAVEGLEDCRKTLVVADKDLMQQVFYNLTENAIKFVNDGGKLTLSVEKDEEQAHIHMRNTGEGLTEQELSRIFDRFYKTDASRGKDTTGVGLGLSIVSRIMVLHSGTVTVKSVYGEYTEFIVSLPLIQASVPQKEQA
ncbi:MAG: HAMP domain-containing histidine kinase, partial [Oscillospiraceae bacterium]|nr:HAMP domain-containing histidine kinase [Oscillospiraceae bacterium]